MACPLPEGRGEFPEGSELSRSKYLNTGDMKTVYQKVDHVCIYS